MKLRDTNQRSFDVVQLTVAIIKLFHEQDFMISEIRRILMLLNRYYMDDSDPLTTQDFARVLAGVNHYADKLENNPPGGSNDLIQSCNNSHGLGGR